MANRVGGGINDNSPYKHRIVVNVHVIITVDYHFGFNIFRYLYCDTP
jgi:hypothetical protein